MSAADTAAYAMVSDERCGDGSPGCRNNPEHLGRMAIIPGGVASLRCVALEPSDLDLQLSNKGRTRMTGVHLQFRGSSASPAWESKRKRLQAMPDWSLSRQGSGDSITTARRQP